MSSPINVNVTAETKIKVTAEDMDRDKKDDGKKKDEKTKKNENMKKENQNKTDACPSLNEIAVLDEGMKLRSGRRLDRPN